MAPRQLKEDRQKIPKINTAANTNTVFSELNCEALQGQAYSLLKCICENVYLFLPTLPKIFIALVLALKIVFLFF